ncbi:unnamed protein product [Arctia plantaginis]|uniref:Methyltransferase type 11 domain-containing protein n=1 Tax=Arctia plantaginis TaxID=874455 RepID=A0A8S0YVJ1_ARCPL|nr:unnamed protein product [Arctia plantaginis]
MAVIMKRNTRKTTEFYSCVRLFHFAVLYKMSFGMNKPELYNASNELQRKAVLMCLKEYSHKIKWNKIEDTGIDLGCGDGSVSVLVKNFAPYSYKMFVACDINEEMINFASKRYVDENISFRVLDIGGEIPENMKGAFNHVFSFYALHWVKDQEKGFRNIHKLMSDGGDCFLAFLASTSIYSIYAILAHDPKWKSWLKNVDGFISPYHEMKNPEKKVAEILEKCGFKNIDVTCKKLTNKFDTVEALKNTVRSVEPFNMPKEVFDDFIQDYIAVGQETGILNFNTNEKSETISVTYDYTLLVICANK